MAIFAQAAQALQLPMDRENWYAIWRAGAGCEVA
jgi:predicted oxidoreductase